MNRLVLIDGNSLLHRAYHALPKTLTSSDGMITNAVFGFTRMLFRVIKDLEPSHVAVAFDRPEPTFRHQEYAGYKAQRPKMEDDLVPQVELTHRVVAGLGIPIYEVAGYEADDVIGTLAVRAAERSSHAEAERGSLEVVIVSGDRDILQLVDTSVKAYMPVRSLSDAEMVNAEKVELKFGLRPEQIVDYKALRGDPSDNIPGVKGIGEKTATALLQKYGSLEEVYARIGEVEPKVAQKLAEEAEQAALSKKLARIETDVPLQFELSDARFAVDIEKAREVLGPLGFKSLVKAADEMFGENGDGDGSDSQLSLV